MSYGDCKEEIAKGGDVMAVVVVEENEEHNEPPPIMKPHVLFTHERHPTSH